MSILGRIVAFPRREMNRLWHGGAFPVFVGVLVGGATLVVPKWLQLILGLPVGLLLPGYCTAILIFGRDEWLSRRDAVARTALIIVLSLATMPLLAVAAYVARADFTEATVYIGGAALAGITLIKARLSGSPTRDLLVSFVGFKQQMRSLSPLVPVVGVLVAGSTVLVLMAASLPDQQQVSTSAITFAGAAATAEQPLSRDGDGGSGTLMITVSNTTDEAHAYTVRPTADRDDAALADWTPVTTSLAAGESATVTIGGSLPVTGCLVRVAVAASDGNTELPPLTIYFAGVSNLPCESG